MNMATSTIEQRVADGADFLDRYFTGWWERIDLEALNIDDCDLCVLGQLWCTAPPAEQGQIMAQAVGHLTNKAWHESAARDLMQMQMPYGVMVRAFEELQHTGTHDLGFNWGGLFAVGSDDEAELLTEAWKKLIIQRRLDSHADVIYRFSDLGSIPDDKFLVAV